MEMVFIFTFCLILAGSDAVTTVTGYSGQSVQIKCSYTSGYENTKKYLCKGKCPSWNTDDVPVQSGSPAKDSRFSLYDDTSAKVFTITITDLTLEDQRTYWCGIEKAGLDIYEEILLLVKMDVSYIAYYVLISTGVLLFAVGVIIAIYCKIKCQGSESVTQSSRETNENDQNLLPLQAREKVDLPESVYQSLELTTNQSDSVYQSLTFTNNQSDSIYHTINITNYQ